MQVTHERSALARTALVSVGVALAILGDSTLYAVLPTQVETLGLSAAAVGLALSINRLTRLVSNPLAAHLMTRYSRSRLFLGAMVLAAITSLAWAFPLPVVILLLARALWGFCWSVLRLTGYLSALSASPDRRGTAFGLFRSIFRIGSLVAAVAAGLLVDRLGFRMLMALIAGVSALGIPIYLCWNPLGDTPEASASPGSSPDPQPEPPTWAEWLSSFAGSRDTLLINLGGLLQRLLSSLLATTMGYHLQHAFSGELVLIGAATLSGLLNAWLWAGNIALSPLYGIMMDRLGRRLSLFMVAGLQVIGLITVGISPRLTPTVIAIMLGLAAGIGMEVLLDTLAGDGASGSAHSGRALASYSNWTDVGAALGPIIGYSIGVLLGLPALYVGGACLTVVWVAVAYRQVWTGAAEEGRNRSMHP